MEACIAVEKEIDKILSKFVQIRENGTRSIDETIEFLASIKPELEQGICYLHSFANLHFPLPLIFYCSPTRV